MREIRTLRATWRGLETWNGRDTSANRRASPRPYLCGGRPVMGVPTAIGGPIYRRTGHPSSCRPRHTDRVVERRSEEPPLTARIKRRHTMAALSAVQAHRGSEGSNPSPSSAESANYRFQSRQAASAIFSNLSTDLRVRIGHLTGSRHLTFTHRAAISGRIGSVDAVYLNCFICRSRQRVGWCEFSALLLSPLCWRCSMAGMTSLLAAP